MQTFLPYASFVKSARSLDYRRLGKQRVECLQILNVLTGRTAGWANHPAARMWRGYEPALLSYGLTVCGVWVAEHGFKDTCADKMRFALCADAMDPVLPPWLAKRPFHRSHRANLVKKLPEHYVPLFGALPWEPYVWPV